MREIDSFPCGDMRLSYHIDEASGAVGLRLIPEALVDLAAEKACAIEPLVQLKMVGDTYPSGFSQGRTMRGSQTTQRLRFENQQAERDPEGLRILTRLSDGRGLVVVHTAAFRQGEAALALSVRLVNESDRLLQLEMLSSFTLGGLSPFTPGEGTGTLTLHRMLSTWSQEGRLRSEPIEALQLEPSWLRFSANSLRFGQVGSLPVRGYHPFVAVSDSESGVTWAASLSHAHSWQLEAYRRDEGLSLSGGLADREFGHFDKHLSPGEAFEAPVAYITCALGDVDQTSQRLLTAVNPKVPPIEESMPIVYNEFCTSWGRPDHDRIVKVARALRGRGVTYFVIDAGWYSDSNQSWQDDLGDWLPSTRLFPDGIASTLAVIRENGLIPGIWFEFEVCAKGAAVFLREDWQLMRDGVPIQSGARRFLDFRKPEVLAYLRERVIGFLKAHGFGYMKVDYNETLGIGADGAESMGEALRQQVEAVQAFFREIRATMPDLVLEVCASGGHRLVPSFMEICAMASFSDAHECDEIPIIAANMHRIIHPWQSQIWAVVKPENPDAKLYYQITSAMLGRICLSGNVDALDAGQWAIIQAGFSLYARLAPILRDGTSVFSGTPIFSQRHPKGYKAVSRCLGEETAVYLHTFDACATEVCAPVNATRIFEAYARPGIVAEISGGMLRVNGLAPFDGMVFLLSK